ncbi:MAG: hypothetical protein IPK96_17420 [Flammeovirgaceae bacterium]|nr:hypothetical protein [Flammeovirgaceae bacterium]
MKKLFSLLFLVTLVWSCHSSKENKEEEQVSESFDQERDAFFTSMLTFTETAAKLQATAAEFNATFMNDPTLFNKYTSDAKAAANLGIYLADLNYSLAYKQSAHAKELFTAAQELSKSIDIEQSVLFFLSVRYEDTISQNDSVQAVLNKQFKKSATDLKGTDREKLVGIAMAAYQIENLHLALEIIEAYPKDMLPDDARTQILIPVFRMVLGQQKNVERIHSFLNTISDPMDPDKNSNHAYYLTALEEMINVYKKLDVNEKIANNDGLELMKDAVVQELRAKVNAIRTRIVAP